MKNFKKCLFLFFTVIISFILVTSFYENIVVTVKTNKFLDNQILDEVHSTDNIKYYYKENKDFYSKGEYKTPGNFCDILVTMNSSVDAVVIHEALSLTVGGHAALVGMKYQDKYLKISKNDTIETTYNSAYKNCYVNNNYRWENTYVFPSYYILRINLTEEQAFIIYNEAISMLDDPYNITFLLNVKKSSYCSDLVSKSFRKAGINLNYDFGATTVIDILANKQCEIIGYKKVENDVIYYYTY